MYIFCELKRLYLCTFINLCISSVMFCANVGVAHADNVVDIAWKLRSEPLTQLWSSFYPHLVRLSHVCLLCGILVPGFQ